MFKWQKHKLFKINYHNFFYNHLAILIEKKTYIFLFLLKKLFSFKSTTTNISYSSSTKQSIAMLK